MFDKDLKLGDKVTVMSSGRPIRIRTIKRVLKRFCELSDGTKWDTHWGNPYPSERFPTWSIVKWEQKHSDSIRREYLKNKIKSHNWDSMPLESLDKISKLLEDFGG